MDNWIVKKAGSYALERLAESQTWLAIIGGITANAHVHLSTPFENAVVQALVAIVAAVAVGIKQGWTAPKRGEK